MARTLGVARQDGQVIWVRDVVCGLMHRMEGFILVSNVNPVTVSLFYVFAKKPSFCAVYVVMKGLWI
jgi:hypothetical protein